MKTKKQLNKATSDMLGLGAVLEQGISVNIRVETQTLVKLIFFAIIVTAVVGATNYGLHRLKINH
jgi:hypothetical protein